MTENDPSPPPVSEPSQWLDDIRAAAAFLTRLPVGGLGRGGMAGLAATAWAFPVVGIAIGFAAGLVYAVADRIGITPGLAAVFAVGGQVWLTGALHEDALGDVADGLGGGATPEAKLEIMRDSRIGVYGVTALALTLAARVFAIAAIAEPAAVLGALIVAGAVSRGAMVALMTGMAPARSDGLGAAAGRPGIERMWTALAIAAAVALVGAGLAAGLGALIGAALGAGLIAWLARRQIGGQTGDVLGASQQAAEVLCLAALVAAY